MRLTLRTLLAYLDDILEPDDSQEISKKVGESEFASNLVHRTRDCVRRLRLGAPPLVGRGLGTDPNTVAEYLDNTLAPERVGEFEKVCLESDVHLAEVASCHQVLTLVLGESADISPDSRERMYQLGAHVDAPPVQKDAMKPAGVATLLPAPTKRAKPEVPDYLRESRSSRLWPMAALVLLGALLTFGLLAVFGPQSVRDRLTAFGSTPAVEQEPAAAEESAPAAAEEPAAAVAQPAAEEPAEQAPAETPAEALAAETTPTEPAAEAQPEAPPEAAADAAPADEPAAIVPPDSKPREDANAPQAPEPQDVAGGELGGLRRKPTMPQPGESTIGIVPEAPRALPPEPKPPQDNESGELPAVPGEPAKIARVPGPIVPNKPLSEEEPAAGDGKSIGSFSSKHEVLLKLNPAGKDWTRLAAGSALAKGDKLLSLPVFRPALVLGSDLTFQADGAAQFELAGTDADGAPVVAVDYGRFLVRSPRPASVLELKLDEHTLVLTFVDAEASVAIDIARVLPAGRDPETGAAPQCVDLYVTSGQVRARLDDAAMADFQAPVHQALVGTRPNRPTGNEFPKWVTSEAPTDLERGAVSTLEPLLVPDRPVALSLGELSNHRRREVRSLAIRANTYLGNFDGCLEGLNDKDEKSLWPTYIEELRAAVARSPESATRVKAALEKQRTPDAAGLYRMLWGYSLEDLKNGADADLVESLNHDSLDFRVLASWNLQNVTGLPSFGYHPSDTAKQRIAGVRSWKDKLKQGKIVPRSTSTPAKGKGAGKGTDRGAS